ncbi:MAG: sugar transferase [Acidimicrobiales bacterium]
MSGAAHLRVIDLTLIAIAAIVWIPALVVCSIAVLVGSGRPILFRQDRAGLLGENFELLKFRSMNVGENPLVPDAAAITSVGRFLRRWSLDELPQLLNVIQGHMSLVGPRPMLPEQADHLDVRQRDRHLVRPGLSGVAQVAGRNTISWHERIEYDLAWAAMPTVRRYVGVLAHTARAVIDPAGTTGHDLRDPLVDLTPTIELLRSADVARMNEEA